MNSMKAGAILVAAAVMLAGCGLRGPLVAPKEDLLGAPTPTPATETATAESGQGKPAGAAPKPHKEFFLDGILR